MPIKTPNVSIDAVVERMAGRQDDPPVPKMDDKVTQANTREWDEVENHPIYDRQLSRYQAQQDALVPQRWTGSDMVSGQNKTRGMINMTSVALVYRNVLATVAMTVPDDHNFKYEPRKTVKKWSERNLVGGDPTTIMYAETMTLIAKYLLDEIAWQETAEAWAMDATITNLGITKLVWQREYLNDSVSSQRRKDEQDNVARFKWLREEAASGRINNNPELWVELMQLNETLNGNQEIALFTGLRAENIPFWSFRCDPKVTDIEKIYEADWMSHDVLMTKASVRQRYPYRVIEEKDGVVTKWSGVHPQHLSGDCVVYDESRYGLPKRVDDAALQRRRETTNHSPDDELVLVREKWNRRSGRVFVMINGVDYPIDNWVPDKQPESWYPFVFLQPNRMPGTIYGVGDVELQKDVAEQILRKKRDEEKARENAIGRGVYSKSGLDDEDQKALQHSKGGEIVGVNVGRDQKMSDVFDFFAVPLDENAFRRDEDYQLLDRIAGQSQALQGVTGSANFATEVQAAQQGTAIATAARQDRYRRALSRFYDMVHQYITLNMTEEEAKKIAGTNAVFPMVLKESEAARLVQEAHKQAQNQITVSMMPQIQEAAQAASQGGQPFDPMVFADAINEQVPAAAEEIMLAKYGAREPLTREALYRRCRTKVEVSVNNRIDAQVRIANAERLMGLILSSGAAFDLTPIIRLCAELLQLDTEFSETGMQDPNLLLTAGLQAASANPTALKPETVNAMLNAAEMVQTAASNHDLAMRAAKDEEEAAEADEEAAAIAAGRGQGSGGAAA